MVLKVTDFLFLLMYDPKFLLLYTLAVLKERMVSVMNYLKALPGLLQGCLTRYIRYT